ncbi:hypothetical protein [Halobaculum sp. P14]|uniref:hypothetical protein n=1 Tax=Halobaculum sp. P14 TaxID=3421638 RepID=UPI003EBDC776
MAPASGRRENDEERSAGGDSAGRTDCGGSRGRGGEQPSVRVLKDALRALAVGANAQAGAGRDGDRVGPADADVLLSDAEAALDDVRAAAAFADDGGFCRLRDAERAAEARNADGTAERCRAVLAAVEAYRAAAGDHFHRGREGLKPGGEVWTDNTS